jgi:hypothetical protein
MYGIGLGVALEPSDIHRAGGLVFARPQGIGLPRHGGSCGDDIDISEEFFV